MVVKSATKKKLMDLGIEEEYAHKLADDKKWDDVKILTSSQIAQICGTDSGTATKIFEVMAGSSKAAQRAAARMIKPYSEERRVQEGLPRGLHCLSNLMILSQRWFKFLEMSM